MVTPRIRFIILFFATMLLAGWSQAVPETHFAEVMEIYENPQNGFQQIRSFIGERNQRVGYSRFGTTRGPRGSVLISSGRTESSTQYLEVAIDLTTAGYGPVYVLDHRGQGLSQRWLQDSHKGDVENFGDYVADFAQFVQIVKSDPEVDGQNFYLLAHSMGSTIAMTYLSQNPSPFRKVALASPLFRLMAEPDILMATQLVCDWTSYCESYVPFGGPFRWSQREFERNNLNHSRERFGFRDRLWRDDPALQLGAPTIRWTFESVKAMIHLRQIQVLRKIQIPILLLQASEDEIVDSWGQDQVCQGLGPYCERRVIMGAYHELLLESDEYRTPTMNLILRHFEN